MTKVVVGERAVGKTRRAIKLALDHIFKGDCVLFVTPDSSISDHAFISTQRAILSERVLSDQFVFNKTEKIITLKDSHSYIKFMPEAMYRSKGYDPVRYRHFVKIYDEYNFRDRDFDYLIVNGELGEDLN
jgi:hypothetical protein